jgi:hypothetical protein
VQQPTHERIQERAYQIWIREGCPHGRHAEHWQQAEFEIAAELRSQAKTETVRSEKGDAAPKKRPSRSRVKSDQEATSQGMRSDK